MLFKQNSIDSSFCILQVILRGRAHWMIKKGFVMTVFQREWVTPKGEIRKAWVHRWDDDKGKQRQKTFKRRREAKDHEIEVMGELKEGTHVPDSTSVTIREVGKLLLERKEANGNQPDSIKVVEIYLRLHILPATVPDNTLNGWPGQFGDLKLSRLTAPLCDTFRLHMLKNRSRSLARSLLKTLKQIIREAHTRGLIKRNPAESIHIEVLEREKVPLKIGVDIPDKRDVRRILAAVSPDRVIPRRGRPPTPFSRARWFIFFFVAAFTGMRASELRALKWKNVDLVGRVIQVVERANREGEFGPPKTGAGTREILISEEVVEELKRWKPICPTPDPDGLVFPNSRGKVASHVDIIERGWYPVLRKLGMTDAKGHTKYGIHGLRHFYASIMIQAGVQAKRLQGLLGHSSLKITMDIYGHLFPVSDTEAAQINGAITAVLAGGAGDDKKEPLDDML